MIVDIIQIIGFLFFSVTIIFVCKQKWISLIICCLFIPCLPIVHGTMSYSFISLTLVLYIIFNPSILHFKKSIITFYAFLLICFSILTYLSVNNGASYFINFVKFIQVSILIFLLLFNKSFFNISLKNIKAINHIFLFYNIAFGFIIHFIFDGYNIGLTRFSGIFFDSNYFALYCFLFYVLSDKEFLNNKTLMFVNFIFIILSLSLSCYIIFLIYVLTKYIFRLLKNIKIIHGLFISFTIGVSLIFLSFPFLLQNLEKYSYSNEYSTYKVVSLTKRFEAQMLAYDLLNQSTSNFLWGLGSGRNSDLTKIALHSFYLQAIFSHGIFYFLILFIIIAFTTILFCKNFTKSVQKICIFSFLCSFFIACGVLDPFFNGFLILFLLLVSAFSASNIFLINKIFVK